MIYLVALGCETERQQADNSFSKRVNKWIDQEDCLDNIASFEPPKEYSHVRMHIYLGPDSSHYYVTCREDGLAILRILDKSFDIKSMQDHGEFWTDRKSVYSKYLTSDGIIIQPLEQVDRATFRTFGRTVYASDKSNIYDSRHGIVRNVDLKSFRVIAVNDKTGKSVYGRDKNNFFFWNEIVEDTVELKKHLEIE